MKTILLLLFPILLFGQQGTYVPIPTQNTRWSERSACYQSCGALSSTYSYFIETGADTIINNKQYTTLSSTLVWVIQDNFLQANVMSNWGPFGAIRQDTNKRVYFYSFGFMPDYIQGPTMLNWLPDTTDVLLFDFSLTVGDTFNVDAPIGLQLNYIVTQEDTITLLNGERRRRLQFSVLNIGPNASPSWIEGIGTDHGMFGSMFIHFEHDEELKCFKSNHEYLYYDPFLSVMDSSDCDALLPINEPMPMTKLIVSPNPAREKVSIYVPIERNECSVSIFSTTGVLLKSEILPLNNNNLSLDRNDLPAGVYLLSLYVDGYVYNQKIVFL